MTLADDPWVTANSPIQAEKLHAIGLIAFRWNSCELGLRLLLYCVSARSFGDVWTETSKMRYSDISRQICKLTNESQNDENVKQAVLYALELYETNRLNRNQFSHFLISSSNEGGLALYNNRNSDFDEIFELPTVNTDLEAIRRVALEINALLEYLSGLVNFFSARLCSGRGILAPPPPLPGKPPLPDKAWERPTV